MRSANTLTGYSSLYSYRGSSYRTHTNASRTQIKSQALNNQNQVVLVKSYIIYSTLQTVGISEYTIGSRDSC